MRSDERLGLDRGVEGATLRQCYKALAGTLGAAAEGHVARMPEALFFVTRGDGYASRRTS
jgi:hypothetical protein